MSEYEKCVFVSGGTGYVGTQVVKQLVESLPQSPWSAIEVLTRSAESEARVSSLGATPVRGDLLVADGAWQENVKRAAFLINCAQPTFGMDYDLRAKMEENLLAAIDTDRQQRAVFVYGSSYYGSSEKNQLMDESSPRNPIGVGPSMEPCVEALESAGASGLDYVAVYPGGIYGAGSWFLDSYVAAIRSKQVITLASPPPVWPYVHLLDCARAIVFMLTLDAQLLEQQGRHILVVDDQPMNMREFVSRVGEVMGRQPEIQEVNAADLRRMLPQVAFEYLTANMPHANRRLKELGFQLTYPQVGEGLASLNLDGIARH
jgi:nucleoside-diphosphate-sugar epimerase